MKDFDLEQLLRAAGDVPNESGYEMPFGFHTRVVARWRTTFNREGAELIGLLRRVVLVSLGVIALASAGAYHELAQSDEAGEPFTDEAAIADSAIGVAFEL